MNTRIQPGDQAPNFEVRDINGQLQRPTGDGQGPVLLTFFRHAGCPMCNLRTRELILAKPELDRYGLQLLGVFESPAESIRRDVGRQNPPFPLLPDPERKLYRLYGVQPSLIGFWRIFFKRPQHVFEAIFKRGFWPKFKEATSMMPAEFLIAPDGNILLTHFGRDIGDHLPLEDLYSALNEMQAAAGTR